jgi:hypothetical protein
MHVNEFDQWKKNKDSEAINEKRKIDLQKRLPLFELAESGGKKLWEITKFGLSGIEGYAMVKITNRAGIKIKVHDYFITIYVNKKHISTLAKKKGDSGMPLVLKSKEGKNENIVKVPFKVSTKKILEVVTSIVKKMFNEGKYDVHIGGYVKPSILGIKHKVDFEEIATKKGKKGNVKLKVVGPAEVPGTQIIQDYVKNPGKDAIKLVKQGIAAAEDWVDTDGRKLLKSTKTAVRSGLKTAEKYGNKVANVVGDTANDVYNYFRN